MRLLQPLGLLGLISLIVLILIYVIRPNFQQKRVSSTYIWKLSLNYRKKRIPVSKLRNILIIICQILVLATGAAILAQPNSILRAETEKTEVIAIIDSSASMRTKTEGETRFERAVKNVLTDFDSLPQDGAMYVIIADSASRFLLPNSVAAGNKAQLTETLNALLADGTSCSYGSSDMNSAMALCESIIQGNPSVQISIYTDTQYHSLPKNVAFKDVRLESEWNVGILNARAVIDDNNYYAFYVDVASYNKDKTDKQVTVTVEVQNANTTDSSGSGVPIVLQDTFMCTQDVIKTIIFKSYHEEDEIPKETSSTKYKPIFDIADKVKSYQTVHISIEQSVDERDSFSEDNVFEIYAGQKEVLKIQYATGRDSASLFFSAAFSTLLADYKNKWDIKITTVTKDQSFATTGFDFYIFENRAPDTMPTDGLVFLFNPLSAPQGSGFTMEKPVLLNGIDNRLSEVRTHPVTAYMNAEDFIVNAYSPLALNDASYIELMSCNSSPAVLVKDEETTKVVVVAFGFDHSNMYEKLQALICNTFAYFLPVTVQANAYEVFDNISLNSRGVKLDVSGYNYEKTFTTFPSTMTVSLPGTYTLEQTTFAGKDVTEQIYVKIPAVESNIWRIESTVRDPYQNLIPIDYYKDLLLFIAVALVAVLFIEWLLHLREEV